MDENALCGAYRLNMRIRHKLLFAVVERLHKAVNALGEI
jgi:hypothetical protein